MNKGRMVSLDAAGEIDNDVFAQNYADLVHRDA